MEYITIILEFLKSLALLILFFVGSHLIFYFIIIPVYMGIIRVVSWIINIIDDIFSHAIFNSLKDNLFFVIGFLALIGFFNFSYFAFDVFTTLIAKA